MNFFIRSSIVLTGLGVLAHRSESFPQRYYRRDTSLFQELAVLSFLGPLAITAIPIAFGYTISKSIDTFSYNTSYSHRTSADIYKRQQILKERKKSKKPPTGGGSGNPQITFF